MKQYFIYDEKTKIYIEPVISSEIFDEENPMPHNWTYIPPIKEDGSGYFNAMFTGTGWIEIGEPPEVVVEPPKLTTEKKLKALTAAVLEISAQLHAGARNLTAVSALQKIVESEENSSGNIF